MQVKEWLAVEDRSGVGGKEIGLVGCVGGEDLVRD